MNFQYGQYNSINQDRAFQVTQTIPFPTYFTSRSNLYSAEIQGSQLRKEATENEVRAQVQYWFYQLQYLEHVKRKLQTLDSLYSDFVIAATLRFESGETSLLENHRRNKERANCSDVTAGRKRNKLGLCISANVDEY